MQNFTPWTSLAGGLLIGVSASLLLWTLGRVAGISGMLGGLLFPQRGETSWRTAFLAGMVLSGFVATIAWPSSIGETSGSLARLVFAGLLVGAGTRLGNGCTSGHGVCGVSRLSPRSLLATLTFMATGVGTVALTHLLK